jgi:hypothetical protein
MVVMARTLRNELTLRISAMLRSVCQNFREFFRIANRAYSYKNHHWTQSKRDDYWSK